MAVSNTTVKQVYSGDGNTTSFAIPFDYDTDDETVVKVYLRDESSTPTDGVYTETLQTDPTEYSISGSNVVMVTAPTANEKLIIIRDVTDNQEFDPVTTAQLDADALEAELDEIVRMVQEAHEKLDRAPLFLPGSGKSGFNLPQPVANEFLKWNSDADGLENSGAITDQDLFTTDSPTFADLTITGLTGSRVVKTDGASQLTTGTVDLTSSNEIATLTASRALVTTGTGVLGVSDVTATELGYLDGVTSNIQDQLDAIDTGSWDPDGVETLTNKTIDADNNTISNIANDEIAAAAAIALNKLAATTASRALVSDGSGFVSTSSVTATELGYVSGVTSSIQSQLDNGASVATFGSTGTPRDVAATGIVSGDSHMSTTSTRQIVFVQGDGGAVDVTANPQIEAHTLVGAEMTICGENDTNTLTLETGNGLFLNGDAILGDNMVLNLVWNGSVWLETGRNF